MGKEVLAMKGITKVYPNGIVANKDISFSIDEGEIHALVGENGAGKSTLMKILFGLEKAQEGKVYLREQEVTFSNPQHAIEHGVGMVHQHFMLVPSLTVAENLVLGVEPKKGLKFDTKKAEQQTADLAKQYSFEVDPTAKVSDISVGTKQKVEILKALFRGAKILILDEPTAVLTPQETKELFKQLKFLKEKGHTIIFISHKLNEVKELCDRLTVMRRGTTIGTYQVSDVSEEDISRLMVGRDVILKVDKKPVAPGKNILNVKNVTYVNEFGKNSLKNVSFNLREGEILGIAGVEGNGQREIVDLVTGLQKIQHGDVEIKGESIKGKSIRDIRDMGTSHVPEDRMVYGVAETESVKANVMSYKYTDSTYTKKVMQKSKEIDELADRLVVDYLIKCNNADQPVKMLSGGNIQKVVVAREFFVEPDFIICDQPTRGIDVGAIEFIRKELVALREKGTAVLLNSADLNEVLELSDRLIVMHEGEIAAFFTDASKITEEELGLYMLGLKKQSAEEIGRAIQ
ncbi:ABC transporter ATP-binding protein [Gottschalkiaceae bacterium SANA]|nr:ABC transporter ATP-binding protein [Gottschalkiaceae bacterium SANA]